MDISSEQLKSRWQEQPDVPLLFNGDRLSQPEFHRRYEAYPDEEARFELVGGIVFSMSPAGFDHGREDFKLGAITFDYEIATPGVMGASNVTVILSEESEPQPDQLLMLKPGCGGKTKIVRHGKYRYVEGPPELVLEVAHSSVALDLHQKRADYRAAGVQEYMVLDLASRVVRCFNLVVDRELNLPSDGILRSQQFPGYWLDSQALFANDSRALADCMARGIDSPEHQAFVEELARRSKAVKKPKPKKKR